MSDVTEGWHIKREFTVGNVAMILALVASTATSFAIIQAKNEEQDRAISRLEATANGNLRNLSDLQTIVGRMDERTVYMVDSLRRIESRQETPQ
jgi:hypothetical protein